MRADASRPRLRGLGLAGALATLAATSVVAAPIEEQAKEERRDTTHVWLAPEAREDRPVARITGGEALVEDRGHFEKTWLHPDARLARYSRVYLWNVVFEFRRVVERKGAGMAGSLLRSTMSEAYPLAPDSREKFKEVFVEAFIEELSRSKEYQMAHDVDPGTLVVRGAVMDIVSRVPPRTARVDVYLARVGEGTVIFELIDPQTGLMQARVGERMSIRPPAHSQDLFTRPTNLNTMWVDVARWARAVASDLRHELEERLGKAEEEDGQPS